MMRRNFGLEAMGLIVALIAVPAFAGDTPEVVKQKQEYTTAYQATHAYGMCEVYIGLKEWQEKNWPEGKPVVEQFLKEKILPRYTSDPAALNGKSFVEIETEYLKLCAQSQGMYQQVVETLGK
jgi:hypothetical protein